MINTRYISVNSKPTPLQSMVIASSTSLICVNMTHPIEIVKTRLQVGQFNIKHMIKTEGISSFWKGIQAAWFREALYTSVKLGGYGPIRDYLGVKDGNSPFYLKFFAGSISGSIGAIMGNPFDVLKTQMMTNTDRQIPLGWLMKKINNESGIVGFYRGLETNILRAFVLNGTKMACYDQIKTNIVNKTGWERNDLKCQFTSAIGAGFFMASAVAPVDMVRTRIMNQTVNNQRYTSFIDATTKIYKKEGVASFYRGFLPLWGRFAPQATLQLVIFDNFLEFFGFDGI